jgi:hypothetical protein
MATEDTRLLARLLQPGLQVAIKTRTGTKIRDLYVAELDGDTVLLTTQYFAHESPERSVRMIEANAVAVALDAIEVVGFQGRNY